MFCNHCGNEILPGASFCSKCGNPVNLAEDCSTSTAPIVYTVTLSRENQWFAINPKVKIIVDDQNEYKIDNGEVLRIPMTLGKHSVVFQCGIRNKVIDLDVQQDLALHLKWNRITGSLMVN